MAYKPISQPLSSILNSNTVRAKTSYHDVLKDIQKKMPDGTITQQRRAARIMRKFNNDPTGVTATDREVKEFLNAMGDSGHLKTRFKKNHAAAVKQIRRNFEALNPDNKAKENRIKLDKVERQKEMREDINRERIRDKEERDNKRATRSIGLKEWQGAKTSINDTSSNNSKDSGVVDMMID